MSKSILTSFSYDVPLEALLGQIEDFESRGCTLVKGGLSLVTGTLLSGILVSRGNRVLFVDAANAFDPYTVARYARRIGSHPQNLLNQRGFLLSRTFTCHQLTVLLEERIQQHLNDIPAIVVISGPLNRFMDENFPWRECKTLFGRFYNAIKKISQEVPLLIVQPIVAVGSWRRRSLFRELIILAETFMSVEADGEGVKIQMMKPVRKVIRNRDSRYLVPPASWKVF